MKCVSRFTLLVFLLLLPGGCGGGTSGTGVRQFAGTVESSTDSVARATARGIAGVRVTSINTGDQTVTDANGAFLLITNDSEPVAALEFATDAGASVVQFDNLPGEDATLSLDVMLKEDAQTVTVLSSTITTEDGTRIIPDEDIEVVPVVDSPSGGSANEEADTPDDGDTIDDSEEGDSSSGVASSSSSSSGGGEGYPSSSTTSSSSGTSSSTTSSSGEPTSSSSYDPPTSSSTSSSSDPITSSSSSYSYTSSSSSY